MPNITGDIRIDALLAGADVRWGVPGQTAMVSYSFMLKAPSYAPGDAFGFSPFSEVQVTATQQVLAQISQHYKIDFQPIVETPSSQTGASMVFGQLRFGNNYQGNQSAAYAYLPYPDSGHIGGDVYINNVYTEQLQDVSIGSYAWTTLKHEIGHAIGLVHPGDYDSTGQFAAAGPFLPTDKDKTLFSIMSYIEHPDGLQRIDFGSYDRLALQYLYGKRLVDTGNTVHRLDNSAGQYLSNLVDDGGVDTLDASAVTADLKLFLIPDVVSSVGLMKNGSAAHSNFTVSFDALIENAIGGAANDYIMGNAANNHLQGGAGNDVLEAWYGRDLLTGGAGSDVFSLRDAGEFVIADFTPGQDSVNFNLPQYGINNLASLLPHVTGVTQEGRDAVVHFVNNVASITFVGLQTSQITTDIVSFNHYSDGVLA